MLCSKKIISIQFKDKTSLLNFQMNLCQSVYVVLVKRSETYWLLNLSKKYNRKANYQLFWTVIIVCNTANSLAEYLQPSTSDKPPQTMITNKFHIKTSKTLFVKLRHQKFRKKEMDNLACAQRSWKEQTASQRMFNFSIHSHLSNQ